MQRSLLLRRTALLALLLLAMWRPREPLAADVLTFDTNGDGVPDLTIPDSDGDGRFEWPPGTTILHGTLHFSAGNEIAFSGYTTIKVDTITIDQGATLVGGQGTNLHQIKLIATHGDISSQGRHLFGFFPGRIELTAQLGSVRLLGSFFLGASTVIVQAPRGSITIQPDPNADASEREIVANTLSVFARNASGSIVIDDTLLVSGRTTVDNHASSSVLTVDKGIRVIDGATLGGGNVTVNATGRITVDDATVSGDDIKLSTSRATDDVCVANGSLLRAVSGRINTYGVRGTPHRDETSTVTGPVVGKQFVVGTCP
jgi:hypothetical protein